MIAVGRALCRWREQHPALAALGLKARLVTDAEAGTPECARSVLTLRISGSDHNARVPFTVTEELKAAEGANLEGLVDAVRTALNNRQYPCDPDAFVGVMRIRSATADRDAGLAGTATLEWEGEASW